MYVVGSHDPGYLPETEPWSTEHFETAVEMLVEEVERAIEDDFERLTPAQVRDIERKITDTKRLAAAGPVDVVSITVDGRRYYAERV